MGVNNSITLEAHAKINLSLEVTGRRADGYHNLRSLMQGIGLYDVIKITQCPQNGTKYNLPHCTIDDVVVYLCTDANTIPVDMSNLAFKGIKAVLDRLTAIDGHEHAEVLSGYDLLIDIDKRLPVAAGIAGGSGNAAACMLGLNALAGYPLSLRELMHEGVKVGADVPFSIMMNACYNAGVLSGDGESAGLRGLEESSITAWITGIGDIVRPAVPVERYVIMANPGISVSTKAAYEAIDALQAESSPRAQISDEDTSTWPLFINDLELYTLRDYQEAATIKDVMQEQLDAEVVLMSGSGPTMVAYYRSLHQAQADFGKMQIISNGKRDWRIWLTTTGIIEPDRKPL